MAITAKQVNELRQKTGAGLMDCKKALVASEGDMEGAIDFLRKKGQKIAEKRGGRDATEGAVIAMTSDDNKTGVVVKVSCETDFVSQNAEFVGFAKAIAKIALDNKAKTAEELMTMDMDGETVQTRITEKVGTIGENISVAAYEFMTDANLVSYIHAGNKIGVLVSVNDSENGDFDQHVDFFKGVAMHIAAMNPKILSYEEFDAEFIAKETEAFAEQIRVENEERVRLGKHLKNVPEFVSKSQLTPEVLAKVEERIKADLIAEGKPEAILDRIVPGKLERFVADNTLLDQEHCLLDQFFALDDSKTVGNAIKDYNSNLSIDTFKRVTLG
ncbi:MAG: translation elongation factor Ts [Chitinophagales bacterium]